MEITISFSIINIMIKSKIINYLKKAIGGEAAIEVFIPENEKFWHYSTNAALKLAKILKRNPIQIAEEIKSQLEKQPDISGLIDKTKIYFDLFTLVNYLPAG